MIQMVAACISFKEPCSQDGFKGKPEGQRPRKTRGPWAHEIPSSTLVLLLGSPFAVRNVKLGVAQ